MAIIDSDIRMARMSADRKDASTHAHDPDIRSFHSWSEDVTENSDEISASNMLDYGAIEQIANGLEKMVQSWSIAQEERAEEYAKVVGSLENPVVSQADGERPITLNRLIATASHQQNCEALKDYSTQAAEDAEAVSTADSQSANSQSNSACRPSQKVFENKSSEEASSCGDEKVLKCGPCRPSASKYDSHKPSAARHRDVVQHIDLRNLKGIAPPQMKEDRDHCSDISQDIIASADISYVITHCESRNPQCSMSKENHIASFAETVSDSLCWGLDDTEAAYKRKVEELQIALLECAAEYEVKMVEMEMKLLQLKSKNQLLEHDPGATKSGDKKTQLPERQEWTKRKLEICRKQNARFQRENEGLSKELQEVKRKERQFDIQRKSLEDALQKVNFLQKEVIKKEDELVDCQLKEKAVRAQLYQVHQKLNSSHNDNPKILSLINALGQWLQTIQKLGSIKSDPRQLNQLHQYEGELSKIKDEFFTNIAHQKLCQLQHKSVSEGSGSTELEDSLTAPLMEKQLTTPPQEKQLSEIRKDVQALQNELEKLAYKKLS